MASKITYDHCPCCGSAAISKMFSCTDHTVSKKIFEVWKCSACTFAFTQNVPTLDYIAPYYQSSAYVSHSDTKEGIINKLYHQVRKVTLRSKRSLLKKITGLKNGTLLDVGAGTGAFAHTMQTAGWHVTGLEPDTAARATALSKYNLELQTLQSLTELQPASYDAITLWHVLEHVHDLDGYFHTFSRLLKNTGRLVVAVPNYTSHDASVYQAYWAAYDVPRHLYHFSPKSMHVLAEEKGFIIEKLYPMWFDSIYVSMLSEQYQKGKNNHLRAIKVGLVSNVKAIFDTAKCSSVIYVMRKK
ncbi:class I SAM-dependent methyltransferase [Aridibaculum aurantiacum]|uniref:class I SAM-dependent methyltransferase n=1 Tax=Aridibaculum aurantiacum TaxID=2810307 RepID=UPI001A95CBCF|nr:class I SAM-dependent methyltransferase [Aridibaculum aurantiacum]